MTCPARPAPTARRVLRLENGCQENSPGSDYSDDERDFLIAMERYKRENRRPFPTWSEVLEVLVSLGYRKVEPAGDLPGIKRDAPPKG